MVISVEEPDGVLLHHSPPLMDEPAGLTVEVSCISGRAKVFPGCSSDTRIMRVRAELDRAHDLSWRGPEAWVWPLSGGKLGILSWEIAVLALTDQEAEEAYQKVLEVLIS